MKIEEEMMKVKKYGTIEGGEAEVGLPLIS
jgi:hypothetical protein